MLGWNKEMLGLADAPSTLVHGQNTVAAAGTEEDLATTQALEQGVYVKALAANTGLVYVGSGTVSSADGYELSAGEQVFIPVADIATVAIDAAVNGEGVSYIGA